MAVSVFVCGGASVAVCPRLAASGGMSIPVFVCGGCAVVAWPCGTGASRVAVCILVGGGALAIASWTGLTLASYVSVLVFIHSGLVATAVGGCGGSASCMPIPVLLSFHSTVALCADGQRSGKEHCDE